MDGRITIPTKLIFPIPGMVQENSIYFFKYFSILKINIIIKDNLIIFYNYIYFQNNYCFEHNFCFEHNYYVQNKQNDVELIQDFDECRQLQF